MSVAVANVEIDALKQRLRATWMAGDYDRLSRFDYPFSPAGVVDFFRDYYGPTNRAFAALTTHDQEALHADLVALWRAQNQSALANRTAVDSEYLQVVAIRSAQ